MRSLIKIGALVVLCGLLVFFWAKLLLTQENRETKPAQLSKSQDTTSQETYVSKVIISVPYAKKSLIYDNEESPPGEFGYQVNEEETRSVSLFNSFTVAPNGDIYIVDPLNKRVQRFSPEGNFISSIPLLDKELERVDLCVDQNENIYLSEGIILKYDQKGNLLKPYSVFTGLACDFVYCDKFGRIFCAYPRCNTGVGFYQVGRSGQVFSLTRQKNSITHGVIGFNSAALDKNLYFQPDRPLSEKEYDLYMVSFDGDTLLVFKSLRGEFFGCDEKLNVYTHIYDDTNHSMIVTKYNKKGMLVSTFQYNCPESYYGIFRGCVNYAFLDNKGSIYVFCQSYGDGIKVIKWYKQ